MRETEQALLRRCIIPVCSTLLAVLLTEWLQPVLAPGRLLFLTAVVVSVRYGGFWAGLLATGLCVFGDLYLLLPLSDLPGAVARSTWAGLGLFVAVALFLNWSIEALSAARRASQELAEALHGRVVELADIDSRKDEFLTLLAHELRSPLAPMLNALRVLRLATDDPPTLQQVEGILEHQLGQFSRVVDELLDNARIVSGKLRLEREHLDLARLVQAALEDHAPEVQAAGLTLHSELPEGEVWIEGDAPRLFQVLSTLLHNAMTFTNVGDQVTVRLASTPNQRAVVAVQDTGIGFEPALLSMVFETDAAGKATPGRSPGGPGLGLALVKALIALHGGDMQATSAGLGQGAEFSFWLPLAREPVVRPAELQTVGGHDERSNAGALAGSWRGSSDNRGRVDEGSSPRGHAQTADVDGGGR